MKRFGDIRNGTLFRVDPTGSIWYRKTPSSGAEGDKYNAIKLYNKNNPFAGKLVNIDLHEEVWIEEVENV